MCEVRRLDEFNDLWPRAQFGPAHIVLGDANLEDEHLDWCLSLIEGCLDHSKAPEEDRELLEKLGWYEDHEREELTATRAILTFLRGLPLEERIEPGDTHCWLLEDLDEEE